MAPRRKLGRMRRPRAAQQTAPARRSWTGQDRFKLAVRFAETDLANLSDGDWLKLREDFADYLGGRGEVDVASLGGFLPMPHGDHPADAPRSWFEDLQREIRTICRYVAGDRPAVDVPSSAGTQARMLTIPRIPIAVQKSVMIAPAEHWIFSVRGPSRDVILEQLFHLLAKEPTDQIRLCARCGKMFYRIRRQEYCSRACVNRAYQESPKGVAIRKRIYAEQGWTFGARTQKATTSATTKGPHRRST